jgi:genome maintenance exonuclease 1
MKLIQAKYKYPEIQRVQNKFGRFYIDSQGQEVPSVTNVLSSTSDQSGIDEWKRRVGNEEAERILQESTSIGSNVHNALENYLQDKKWEILDDGSYISKTSILILESFIKNLLSEINEVWGLEAGLILDGLYAGTADCIGIFNGQESLIDFKTAKKIKPKEWIEDYFLQCAAYANAHNVIYNTNIKQIVILMVDRNQEFKKYIVNDREFDHYTNKWKQRLIKFHNNI